MSRKPISVILFTLVLVGLLNSAFKIQPIEVAVCSGYEANLEKAALFLNSTQFDPTVGLCREAPNVAPNTYWLVSDNLLAYHALKYYYPETAEVIYATMLGYGYFRSFKHEVVFGTTIPYIPFKTNNTYVVAQIGTKFIETEVCNGSSMDDYKEYADLCIFAALHFYWSGNISQAIDHFNMAKNMWNGTLHGVYDKASKDAENEGERLVFSTYKLSLLLYCSRILGQPLEDKTSIEETLWLMQDGEHGGLHTHYDMTLNYTGSDMNTETTSIAILAYMYEPKIVNRPVQYPPPLNIPPDYQKIQEAVNSANEGDTVFVRPATYNENIILNVSISLIGEAKETTIIDVRGIGNPLEITANRTIVSGFTFSYGGTGIVMKNSHNNLIKNNILRKNSRGIGGSFYTNTILENNTVTENDYGIDFGHLSGPSSKNNTAKNNEIHSNTNAGIYVSASEGNNSIVWNRIHDNAFGIVLDHTQQNEVSGNLITDNSYGIYMRNAIQDTIEQNLLQNNVVGIHLEGSNGNNIFHNNFAGNTVQVEGASYNTWDDDYPSGGNYWSDYSGQDLYKGPDRNITGSDGIGDSIYRIDADNIDRYPLMQQYNIPEFPSFLILPIFMIATLLAVIVYKRKHTI